MVMAGRPETEIAPRKAMHSAQSEMEAVVVPTLDLVGQLRAVIVFEHVSEFALMMEEK